MYQQFQFFTKWPVLEHLVVDLKQPGGLECMNPDFLESSRKRFKKDYNSSSELKRSALSNTLRI